MAGFQAKYMVGFQAKNVVGFSCKKIRFSSKKYCWFSSEMLNNRLRKSWCWLLRLKSDLHDAQQGLFPLQSLSILCIEGFLGDTKDVEDFEFWCRCKTQYF